MERVECDRHGVYVCQLPVFQCRHYVSNVTIMESMFADCEIFNGDISGWTVSNVTNTDYMFRNCTSFNGDLSGWDISDVTRRLFIFDGCYSLVHLPHWVSD
mmetsp:Transcript_34564/g.49093  ORF Transcript_34564/g.49093 Transcript_34564/m.49093 type:complete len:101 (-) Transcript_34564:420-722(-)